MLVISDVFQPPVDYYGYIPPSCSPMVCVGNKLEYLKSEYFQFNTVVAIWICYIIRSSGLTKPFYREP